MILTCPECSTKYLTKPEAIGVNGRTVRCAKCEATWFVSAEDAAKEKSELTADQRALEEDLKPQAVDDVKEPNHLQTAQDNLANNSGAHVIHRDKADAEKLSRRRRVIWAIWLVPLLLILLAAILAYIFRQDIVNRVPQAATIYQSFGITVKTVGLEIERPTARTAIVEGETVLVVNSAIRNLSGDALKLPMVELTLHNRDGEQLAQWYVEPKQTMLAPNGRLEFSSQFPDPPVDAVKLRHDFAKS